MVTKKKTWLYFIFLLVLTGMLFAFSPCYPSISWSSDSTTETTFSLDVEDEPIGEVVEKISKATGYEITIDPEYAKLFITMSFKNVTVDVALRRIFGKLSKYMIINDAEKKISLNVVDAGKNKDGAGKTAAKAIVIEKNIDQYAQEYMRGVEKRNQESIQADNMDDYAEQYMRRIERNNPKPEPIQASSFDEYAEKYIRRTKKK